MVNQTAQNEIESEYKSHRVTIEGDITAVLDSDTPEDAIDRFWEGANGHEEFEVGLVGGLEPTVTIDQTTLTATAEGGQYVVEADVDVSVVLRAIDAEDAFEQFDDGINGSYYTDFGLVNGVDVSLYMERSTISATV